MDIKDIEYNVITSKQIRNYDEAEEVVTCQDETMKRLEISYFDNKLIHFFDSHFGYDRIEEMTIEDAIQCLAIKEGYDMVRFENGQYGFIAYYNGAINGFEILEG